MYVFEYFLPTLIWNLIVLNTANSANSTTEEPVERIILQNGYPLEIHNDVQTLDGYLLKIYRIPHGRNESLARARVPVLLMHGLFGCSGNFVDVGPDRSLAFLLADRYYDVWMVNARGTRQSRKHVRLNPDRDKQFWQFSWHEIGLYDLTAAFDLITNVTNYQKLMYLGISQGTTDYYVLASENPAVNERVALMAALAPIAFLKNFNNPMFKFLARIEPMWTQLVRTTGLHELLPQSMMIPLQSLISALCKMDAMREMCAAALYLMGGMSVHMDKSSIPTAAMSSTSGIATRQLLHYAQNVNSGEFRKYDYGPQENQKLYGSPKPPAYNVSRITTPVAIYYSEGDTLANYKDVEEFCKKLPNCVHKYKVPTKLFNHFDFALALDVVNLVYNDLFRIMDEYSKNVI